MSNATILKAEDMQEIVHFWENFFHAYPTQEKLVDLSVSAR